MRRDPQCAGEIPAFIAETAARLVEEGPKIIGSSTMGQQTMASIALAREVKRLNPAILTVLGGANAVESDGHQAQPRPLLA